MEKLLMVAVVLIALAIVAQAVVLIATFLMSRRLAAKAEALMDDSKKLMVPLESIACNLKTVSNDLVETGKMAREQVVQIQGMVSETKDTVHDQIYEVREVVRDTVDEARTIVMRPLRESSAIMSGISAGLRTFFSRRRQPTEPKSPQTEEHQHPAA